MRALYARLATSPGHAGAAFDMMANWDLPGLARDLPRLDLPLTLIAGAQDGMVPPADADETARRMKRARVVKLAGLGHLAHEERPDLIAPLVRAALEAAGTRGAGAGTALPLAG
jgi:magnesium chelatase accessory protein